ncbi:MAG: nitrous oxide reductase accessory protein NosL [Pseudomonadales bacterium]|nr:nitrous oxide reductase accessory protein NosL [Pseudomonadales bacterium]
MFSLISVKVVIRYGVLLLYCFVALAGCEENEELGEFAQAVVAIESGDECHLCGMLIGNFPGPKGEMYLRRDPQIKKFCSTRDMLSFYLQPENTHHAEVMYVHDMAVTPWDNPDDKVFIDAKTAWYVSGMSKKGAMGGTLASFSTEGTARQFIVESGGELLSFDQITLTLLATGL